jgi:hypothetical protein
MRIDGVEVRDSAVAELALLLQDNGDENLASKLDLAIAELRDEFEFRRSDRLAALSALRYCSPGLWPLRDRLLDRVFPLPVEASLSEAV